MPSQDFSTLSLTEQLAKAKEVESFLLSKKTEKAQKEEKKQRFNWLRKIGYFFLLGFGLIKDSVGNFLFGYYLFALIPLIPNPLLIAVGIVFAALNCIAFYAFEGSILRKALGIKDSSSSINQTIAEQLELIKTVKHINTLFQTLCAASTENYDKYKNMVLILNETIEKRKDEFTVYQESTSKRGFRIFMNTFGFITTVASSYFIAITTLSIFAVSLAATPLAWIFVGLVVGAGICVYFLLKASSINSLINPQQKFFDKLEERLTNFEVKKEEDFSKVAHRQITMSREEHELEKASYLQIFQNHEITPISVAELGNPFDEPGNPFGAVP